MEINPRPVPKFTCYFCNKVIENDTEVGHTTVCGNVLVPCVNKCGAYVPRMGLQKHNKECVNRTTNTLPKQQKRRVPNTSYGLAPDSRNIASNNSTRTTNNGLMKNDNQNELYKLSRKIADLESRFQFQQDNNNHLSTSLTNYEKLKTSQLQLNLDLEKIKYQNQLAYDWRKKTDSILEALKVNLSSVDRAKRDLDSKVMGLQTRMMLIEKLQDQISGLVDSFRREQAYNRQVDMSFEENFEEIKKTSAQENAKNLAILGDVKDALDITKQDIENAKVQLEDQGIKFTNIIYDLRGVGQSASEAIKKMENMEKEYENLKKEFTQMKLDMEILEGLTSSNDFRPGPGRLLWRITEVDAKMIQAKQSGNVVKSPIFFTHEYGYRVRVLMYMNGLKKWKDRYALLCLHVLKGDFDMVLKWPCNIEGTVVLRDLDDLEKAKPFTKVITAKRQTGNEECEEPQESSSCYIFIPHSTLLKSNHVKNDTIFLDIKIRQNNKLETSL
ncbi:TNF receptor-associated factor 5 isoform X1 [Diorhabda sublineata]|uniref:TNF receptor-associated factor 5 isoform X1 n=1 Tax=Diorhabda sublineata TaxID=1163346 RepID=UPI0024E0EA3C|nr:TNF receptor-associated factor 5 isoform X1 [Diorhabda sublineata]